MRRAVWIAAALGVFSLVVFLRGGGDRGEPVPAPSAAPESEASAADLAGEGSAPVDHEVRSAVLAAEPEPEVAGQRAAVEGAAVAAEVGGFVLEGVVVPGPELGIEEDARVSVLRRDRGKRYEVVGTDVDAEGSWDPLEVPLERGEFIARFESFQAIPVELELGRPAAGEVVPVEFQVRKGGVLFFEVDDPAGEMVLGATLTGAWRVDGGWVSRTARQRPDGYYAMRGLPAAVVTTTVEAQGFKRSVVPLVVPELDPSIHVVNLERGGGGIRGRCERGERGAAPLADFDLVLWPKGERLTAQTLERRDSDGTFEVSGLAEGTYQWIVQVPGSNQSPLQYTTVPEHGFAEVVARVPEPTRISGRVVSAVDGRPLAEATVRAMISGGDLPALELGDAVAVRADGRFEELPVTPGTTRLRLRAPGHALLEVRVPGPESPTDMGDLALQPTATCEVHLRAPAGTDLTRFLLEARSAGLPMRRFPADGVLRLELGPGQHTFFVEDTEGSRYAMALYLEPGERWVRELRVGGGPRITVTLRDPERAGRGPRTDARVVSPVEGVERTAHVLYGVEDSFVIDSVNPGTFQLDILRGGETVGSAAFLATEEPEQSFELELGRHGTVLRLVDGEGEPVPNAEVRLVDPGAGTDYWGLVSDHEGRVLLAGTKHRNVLLTVKHPTRGSRTAVPILLPEDPDEELVFVLEPGHRVRVHAFHAGLPAPGIRLELLTTERKYFDEPKVSDGEGVAHWNDVPAGDYLLRVEQAGYWIDLAPLSVGDSDVDTRLELRALGDLELHATQAEGLPVGGVEVELRHLDLGTDFLDWVAQGRLGLPDQGMRTDTRGELLVRNLPEGRYRWSVTLPGGDAVSGVAIVRGGELARAAVRLP